MDVPCAAAAQVITLKQTAKSPTTGVTVPDTQRQGFLAKDAIFRTPVLGAIARA